MSNRFVFFVKTGNEQKVCDYLNETLNDKDIVAFIPKIELIYKNSRQIRKEHRPMFPGYVFTETMINGRIFLNKTMPITKRIKHIISILNKENSEYMVLRKEEKEYLLGFGMIKFKFSQQGLCDFRSISLQVVEKV